MAERVIVKVRLMKILLKFLWKPNRPVSDQAKAMTAKIMPGAA
jgi:hypothetical protein